MLSIGRSRLCQRSLSSVIRAHCGDSDDRADRLRSLIRVGLRTGSLPLPTKPSLFDIRTVNAIVSNYKACGFYDYRIITDKFDQILGTAQKPDDLLELVSRLNRLGHYNEHIVLQGLASLLKTGSLLRLLPAQHAELIHILADQRVRLPEVVERILQSSFEAMTATQQSRVLVDVAMLKLHIPSTVKLPQVPEDGDACFIMIKGILLNPTLMEDRARVEPRLRECIARVVSASLHKNPRDISLIWHALKFCYPGIYDGLTDSAKAWFAMNSVEDLSASVRGSSKIKSATLADSVSGVLFKINVRHSRDVVKGPFTLDIMESGRKVVWMCDQPSRFYTGADIRLKTAYFELQDRVLIAMGYKLVHVPYWHWNRITNQKSRREYCRMNRFTVVEECRSASVTSARGTNPAELDVQGFVGDVSSPFKSMGETFLRKEQPKNSWSWHSTSSLPVRISL